MKQDPLPPATAPPAHVLVLDDEGMVARTIGELLGLRGYRTTVCDSARQALELVAHRDFDLVLSDYRMPFMSGKEFFLAVTRLKPALAKRFIFLTGDAVGEETRAFLETAGAAYLAKPFHLATLDQLVVNLLRAQTGLDTVLAGSVDWVSLCA
ncbi:MAG: response regulator [Verrucomicrobia bacterium]|nr:response regulator [Verrucomicrobiota bacterium]